jgi:Cytotoxic
VHGEIEAFNERGRHVAVLDAVTGEPIKGAVPGRRIDV